MVEAKERILEATDIHKATEMISVATNKPVIIENKNFELISYSTASESFDQTQQKTILYKKCPVFIIDRLKKEGIVQQLENNEAPIRIAPIEEIGFYQRIVVKAIYEERTMGYLWVQETNSPLTEEEVAFLTEITPHIGKLIHDSYQKGKEHEGKQEKLLWNVLLHEYESENQMRRKAQVASLPLPERFSVLVMSIAEPTQEPLLNEVLELLSRFKRHKIQVLKTELQIVAVISGDKNRKGSAFENSRELIEYVKSALTHEEFYSFLIGIGKEYTELIEMRKSFLEALEVIETADFIGPRPDVMPREFSKLGVYRYLAALYEKNNTEHYFNQNLLNLMEKDSVSHSSLLKTLEVYLSNNGKGKSTAAELFIHPNTLNYRMKQIQDLTDIDFDDFNMKSHIYIELLLLNNIPSYYNRYLSAVEEQKSTAK
ncbi:helix-turn-helix domain-containing protein [Alkalihalobacillus hwajinpoensis]|uniref:PucR family transcriptional regulator n=1 Tax=Guptibacillus hwajinpoensis TaxID=208199 RepID=UPI00188350E4|nr:helix-turn-helix domain-containing protein [Pseudalkalibacillus hwajinpoensis]MBF0707352.1 helix-turn-helix domain-containing protein [Pseudalkalibacillus hwajinpoensis]